MHTKVSFWSRRKLLLMGSALFLSSFFFGGQAQAFGCTWSASTSQNVSVLTNWDNGSGAACSSLTQVLQFGSVTNTNAVFDVSTTTGPILFTGSYTGSVTIASGVTVTTTGDLSVNRGTLTVAANNTINVMGNFGVSSTFNMTGGTINISSSTATQQIQVTTTLNMSGGTLNLSGLGITAVGAGTMLLNDVNITASTSFALSATSTGNVVISGGSGSLNLGTSNLSLSGNLLNNGVSLFQASAGTVTMTGNSKLVGGTGNTTFYNLYLNDLTSLNGNVTTTNNLTVISNLTGNTSSVDYYLVVGGDFRATASAQLDSGYGHGHLTMTGSGKVLLAGNQAATLKSLDINSGASITAYNSFQINATTTVAGTLNAATSSLVLYGDGASGLSVSGTFNPNTSTITFNGAGQTIPAASYYNLTVGPSASGSSTFTGNATTTNNLTVNSNSATLDLQTNNLVVLGNLINTNGQIRQTSGNVLMSSSSVISSPSSTQVYNLNISGTTTVYGGVTTTNALVVSTGGVFNANTSTVTLVGTSTPLVVNGTFNVNTSTIIYAGDGALINSSTVYYNLIIRATSVAINGAVTTTNDFTISSGKDLSLGTSNFVIGGNFSNLGTLSQTAGSVTMSGNSAVLSSPSSTQVYNLNITGTTTVYGSVTSSNVLTISGKLNANTSTIVLASTSVPLVVTGTFNTNTSTIIYAGNGALINSSTVYYNLIIRATSVSINGPVTTTNDVTIIAGKSFTLNSDLNVGGSLNNSGTLTSNGSGSVAIVTMNGTGNLGGSGVTNLESLTINGNVTLAGNVTSTTYLTINSGKTFTATGYDLVASIFIANSNANFVQSGSGSVIIISSGGPSIQGGFGGGTVTFYDLTIRPNTSLTYTVTTTHVLTVNSGSALSLNSGSTLKLTGTGTPLVLNGGSSGLSAAASSSVIYSGATVNIASTTYYNLFVSSTTGGTLTGTTTVSSTLAISSGATLNAGTALLTLPSSTTPFVNNGTFNSNSSTVRYTSTSTVTTTGGIYWNLTLGSGTYNLGGVATSSNAFTNSGTFNLGNYNFVVASGTFTNNGTSTLSGTGVIKKPSSGGLTTDTYTSGSANGTGNTISISVTDTAANLLANTVETKTITLTGSTYSDEESVTLTETGAATGVFEGTIPFNIASGASSNSKMDVSGNGTLTLAYTNGYGALSGSGTSASYTGSAFSTGSGFVGGGGGGGGSSSVVSPSDPVSLSAGAKTTSQTITLKFSVNNVAEVAVSEDPGFAGAVWEVYTPTKQFTLSKGEGQKTIYVKFRSATGGVTSPYKVSVNLESGYKPTVEASKSTSVSETSVTTGFSLSNPDSKVVILPVKQLEYKPNSSVVYTYKFTNDSTKTVKVKVVKQVVNSSGKVVSSVTGNASLAKGKTFTSKTSSVLNSKLADGTYTVKVQVLDFKTGKLIDQNSFDVTVKKPLPPPPPASISTSNPDSKVVITGLKVDYKPGSAVKYTYSYKNETGKPLKVKIVRQVLDANGKVVVKADGTRTLAKGQKMSFNTTSALSSKLAVGTYTVKVQILDAKNAVLDENGFDFMVKK